MRHDPAPQPSSTVTTLRGLLMLGFLVAIPAIAFRGTVVPGMVREYLIEKLGGSVARPAGRTDLTDAPLFVSPETVSTVAATSPLSAPAAPSQQPFSPSGNMSDELPLAPSWYGPPGAPAGPPDGPQLPGSQGLPLTGNGSAAVLANYDSPSVPSGGVMPSASPSAYSAAEPPREIPGSPQALPATQNSPARGSMHLAEALGGASTVDQFVHIERRLRELGAEYYLLENWGNQGECYRFHCRIAVTNSPNFTRHFEATDSQPLGAMTRVLAEVESWRRGGLVPESPPSSAFPVPASGPRVDSPVPAPSPHGPYAR
ncbi:MAG: hypothetical protein ACYC6Y_24250 [Thermoguttaceae bacterium]